MEPLNPLLSLPVELTTNIFSYLDDDEVLEKVKLVCQDFNLLIGELFCKRKLNDLHIKIGEDYSPSKQLTDYYRKESHFLLSFFENKAIDLNPGKEQLFSNRKMIKSQLSTIKTESLNESLKQLFIPYDIDKESDQKIQ